MPRLDLQDTNLERERLNRALPFSRNPFETAENYKVISDRLTGEKKVYGKHGTQQEEEEEAELVDGPWTEGLTDLFFVAALSSFNQSQTLTTRGNLASYVGFFTVIWWTWTSQILYDVRYQTSDLFHRLVKIFQLVLYATWAGYSAYLDFGFGIFPEEPIVDVDGDLSAVNDVDVTIQIRRNAMDDQMKRSIQTFALVYLISRAVLLLQYARLLYYAWISKANKRTFLIPISVLCLSSALWGLGYVFLVTSDSKGLAILRLVFWFGGILLEMSAGLWETQLEGFVRYRKTNVGERLGLLTLIIIGEPKLMSASKGVIALVSVAQGVIYGLGFTAVSYIQVLVAFLIIYCLWAIYFDGFSRRLETGRIRSIIWVYLHLFLQLSIVFTLAGVRSSLAIGEVTVTSRTLFRRIQTGFDQLSDNYQVYTPENIALAEDLSKFQLDWIPTLRKLNDIYQAALNGILTDDNAVPTLGVLFDTDLVVAIYQKANIELGSDILELRDRIKGDSNETTYDNLTLLQNKLLETGFRPTLYVFPAAGLFLTLLLMIRLVVRWPSDVYAWLSAATLGLFGGILILFLLFSKGRHTIEGVLIQDFNATVYKIANASWLLPAIFIVYVLVILLEQVLLRLAKREYKSHGQGRRKTRSSFASEKRRESQENGLALSQNSHTPLQQDFLRDEYRGLLTS
ncbi:hypothetical protein BT69DRAFT_1297670 [Atractiella rhizophila]|nr:hypothetical protein BT69DRAFT_1297670 [Atractiella rhizophila]